MHVAEITGLPFNQARRLMSKHKTVDAAIEAHFNPPTETGRMGEEASSAQQESSPPDTQDRVEKILQKAKEINTDMITKSSIILGLGEREEEIYQTIKDLRDHNVDIVTLGQYLRPTLNHHPIDRWVKPEEFDLYRKVGLKYGFLEVISSPMARSSYRAERALDFNNAGIKV